MIAVDPGPVQRFGIEEEYFITDLDSRRLLAEPSAEVLHACRQAIGPGFAYEMFQGQIEVASPVFEQGAQAASYLRRVRRDLGQALARHGLGFVCAGSHPLADWRLQRATPQPHFQQLFGEFALVARRSLLCGLHVHAEIPPGVDRVAVMNEVLPWLPMLLALSVSSPIWQGEHSGYLSYRQVACDEWPRMGIPEQLSDEADFRHYLRLLREAGAMPADANVWWCIRPSLGFPTLELRITDACPRLADSLLLAALFRVMIRHACQLPAPGSQFSAERYWLLKENRAQARRWGPEGRFLLAEGGGALTLAQWLERARQTFAATARSLGEEQVFDQALRLLQRGTSAERQLRCLQARANGAGDEAGRRAVVDELLEESAGTD
ncbi:carboxylate-amine ligase [Pseudomonas chlororaphis]|uniref:carboxylate-amine ligase n=1 Tax=Pseudomonas chlororaphis TaxID=587753 RepID=UPI001E317D96|nr:carboxylate-amine ligase [Pseudomonas chlororaphis]